MPISRHLQALKRMHGLLTLAMIVMIAASVAFIYSAAYGGPAPSSYKWQAVWFGVGLIVYLVVSLVDYRVVCQWASVWYAIAVGLLLLVLIVGKQMNGSKSWLRFGGFGIQPAEFAKLAAIVALSYYLFIERSSNAGSGRRCWGVGSGGFAGAIDSGATGLGLSDGLAADLFWVTVHCRREGETFDSGRYDWAGADAGGLAEVEAVSEGAPHQFPSPRSRPNPDRLESEPVVDRRRHRWSFRQGLLAGDAESTRLHAAAGDAERFSLHSHRGGGRFRW